MHTQIGDRAVVLGASLAGLLAARVLADSYGQVTVIDRDDLPQAPMHRRGVPHGRHIHALLARGHQALEELLPGLTAELVAFGVPTGDMLADARLYLSGHRLRQVNTGLGLLCVSRPALEGHVRARLRALPNVRFLDSCDVVGLTTTPDSRRVTGARVLRRVDGSAEERVAADLVVDATGRGYRTPVWLEALGYTRPEREQVRIGLGYATRTYRLPPDALDGDLALLQAATPQHPRTGALHALDGDRWMLTLAGILGDHPPLDPAGFLDFARSLRFPDIHQAIRDAEPLDDPVGFRFPASVRHRYERLDRFPDRLLVLGDAVASFNPIYGQGMSVAAVEALALRRHLERGTEPQPRRWFRDLACVVDVPWDMAAGGDLVFPGVLGRRTLKVRLVSTYLTRLHAAAAHDAHLSTAFIRVAGLVAPPSHSCVPASSYACCGTAWGPAAGTPVRPRHRDAVRAAQTLADSEDVGYKPALQIRRLVSGAGWWPDTGADMFGPRYATDVRIRRPLEARTVGAQGALVRGREAAERLAWADAYAALVSADRSTPLAAENLELLATAAYLLGHVEHCLGALQRAHQLYAEGGDHRRAAWCAGWLGFHLSSRGDLAQASGWFGRASRLLEHARQEGIEHGYLLTSVAFQQLMAGEYADARATAERAAAIGGRAGDADLVAFGLYLQGRALVWDGRVGEGLALLDEAMVAVVAGELSPVVAGTVYCGTIEICQAIAELRRAQEWTEALTTWWGRQPDMVTFTGQCLVHRAEILQLHGAWPEAVEEAKRAGERFAHAADDYATGAACHQQAELYRLSGDFSAAEDAYGQASRWVTSPSRAGAAAAGPGQDRRGRGGDPPGGGRDEPAVQADEAAARAGRDHAGGRRPPGGTRCRRRADRDRQRLRHASSAGDGRPCSGCGAIDRRRPPGCAGCPACRVAGAQAVFARLGARPDLARVEELAGSEVALSAHGLTRRELQVLRLLATGKTNQAIATDLVLAEKTVHRHVSNIFTKLNVSSRAAATAYADQHHLL